MKRIVLAVVIIVFLSVALAPTAYCADAVYEIPELYMTLTLPESLTVIFNGDEIDTEELAALDCDEETARETFKKQNLYLYALDEGRNFELSISMTENNSVDPAYCLNNVYDLDELIPMLTETFTIKGAKILNSEFYEHEQAIFAVFDYVFSSYGEELRSRSLITIYNSQLITLTFNSMTDNLSEPQISQLMQIVDSITFTGPSVIDQARIDTASQILAMMMLLFIFSTVF